MIDQTRAAGEAIEYLTRRIDGMEPGTDAAAVAAEFMAALIGQGWRKTAAEQAQWRRPTDLPAEPNADFRAARAALERHQVRQAGEGAET